MQRRITDQLSIRFAKVDILEKYWDVLLREMYKREKRKCDSEIHELLNNIFAIPGKIKKMVLMAFVNKCRELYQIAFFQWRRKHPHKLYTKMDEVEELIEFRIEYTFKRYQIPSEDEEDDDEEEKNSLFTDESMSSINKEIVETRL